MDVAPAQATIEQQPAHAQPSTTAAQPSGISDVERRLVELEKQNAALKDENAKRRIAERDTSTKVLTVEEQLKAAQAEAEALRQKASAYDAEQNRRRAVVDDKLKQLPPRLAVPLAAVKDLDAVEAAIADYLAEKQTNTQPPSPGNGAQTPPIDDAVAQYRASQQGKKTSGFSFFRRGQKAE